MCTRADVGADAVREKFGARCFRISYTSSEKLRVTSMPRPVIIRLDNDKITQNTAGPRVIHGDHLTDKCFAKVDRTHRPICTPSPDHLTLTMTITAEMTSVLGSMDVEVFEEDGVPAETVLKLTVERPRAAAAPAAAAAAILADPKIGILSSIEFTNTPIERAFRLGLGRDWEFVTEVDIGYERGALEDAADRLLAALPQPQNLIVGFGGNIVAQPRMSLCFWGARYGAVGLGRYQSGYCSAECREI